MTLTGCSAGRLDGTGVLTGAEATSASAGVACAGLLQPSRVRRFGRGRHVGLRRCGDCRLVGAHAAIGRRIGRRLCGVGFVCRRLAAFRRLRARRSEPSAPDRPRGRLRPARWCARCHPAAAAPAPPPAGRRRQARRASRRRSRTRCLRAATSEPSGRTIMVRTLRAQRLSRPFPTSKRSPSRLPGEGGRRSCLRSGSHGVLFVVHGQVFRHQRLLDDINRFFVRGHETRLLGLVGARPRDAVEDGLVLIRHFLAARVLRRDLHRLLVGEDDLRFTRRGDQSTRAAHESINARAAEQRHADHEAASTRIRRERRGLPAPPRHRRARARRGPD